MRTGQRIVNRAGFILGNGSSTDIAPAVIELGVLSTSSTIYLSIFAGNLAFCSLLRINC
jgi:hypothetical protein